MPIGTDRNTTYGGTLVTTKYSPLRSISFEASDAAVYSRLLFNRWSLLKSTGLLPQPLNLAVANWKTTIDSEAEKKPPLVVISSNRSEWIKAGITAARTQTPFANASDLTALTFDNKQGASPPIYSPSRIGDAGPRNVYVVVHLYEYDTYLKNLAGTDITVVGWSFRLPRTGAARLTGFGASRFAAIEFCKELMKAATVTDRAPWKYAWLFDDNVVALSQFAGYGAVEAAMTDGDACAGFRGCTKVETFEANRSWADDEIDEGRGAQAAALPLSEPPGIPQQAVLWNIDYLTKQRLNFGPVFVTSGEDVSLGNYFNKLKTPYFYYKNINVIKEQTGNDNDQGSQWLRQAREGLTAWFSEMEGSEPKAATPPPPPPPPIKVQPTRGGDGVVQTLGEYIVKRVLPGCGMYSEHRTVPVVNTANSQAVEQIMSGAINARGVTIDADVLEKTFKINGTSAQTIVRIDKPART